MSQETDLMAAARGLFHAIEAGDVASLKALYAPDVVQIEFPNKLKAKGDRRGIEQMIADLLRGKKMLKSEHYEIETAVVTGDRVALEVRWEGVLAVPVGALAAGGTMRAFSAIFLTFRDGKVLEQRNYDCFEDFLTPKAA